MRNCLVIKTSSFGDIYQTLPSILEFRKHNPECRITWVVEKKCQEALKPFFDVDELLVCDFKKWKKSPFLSKNEIVNFFKTLRARRYDLALDFQANSKSGLVLLLTKSSKKQTFHPSQVAEWPQRLVFASRIKVDATNYRSFYKGLLPIKDLGEVQSLPQIHGAFLKDYILPKRFIIMLGLGSMWHSKQLSESQILNLLKTLDEKYKPYFLIPALESQAKTFQNYLNDYQGQVLQESSINAYIPYLLKTNLFVGVDSAFLHLARLLQVPSQAYFGPSSALFYGSSCDIQGICPFAQTFQKRCSIIRKCHGPCIKNIII